MTLPAYYSRGGALMLPPILSAAPRLRHPQQPTAGRLPDGASLSSRGGSHPPTAARLRQASTDSRGGARGAAHQAHNRGAAPTSTTNLQGGSIHPPTAARLQQASNTAGRLVIHPTAAARLQHQASKPQGGSSKQPTDSRGGAIPGEAPASLSVTKIPTNDSLI